jgi:hypothetical protein
MFYILTLSTVNVPTLPIRVQVPLSMPQVIVFHVPEPDVLKWDTTPKIIPPGDRFTWTLHLLALSVVRRLSGAVACSQSYVLTLSTVIVPTLPNVGRKHSL